MMLKQNICKKWNLIIMKKHILALSCLLSISASAQSPIKMIESQCNNELLLVKPKIIQDNKGLKIKFISTFGGINPNVIINTDIGSYSSDVKINYSNHNGKYFAEFYIESVNVDSIIIDGCEIKWSNK